jgi:hypothetical protein
MVTIYIPNASDNANKPASNVAIKAISKFRLLGTLYALALPRVAFVD